MHIHEWCQLTRWDAKKKENNSPQLNLSARPSSKTAVSGTNKMTQWSIFCKKAMGDAQDRNTKWEFSVNYSGRWTGFHFHKCSAPLILIIKEKKKSFHSLERPSWFFWKLTYTKNGVGKGATNSCHKLQTRCFIGYGVQFITIFSE